MHPKTLDELIAQSIQDKSVETIDPELLKTLFVDYKDLIKYVTQTPIMGEGIARFVIASVIRSLGSKHLYQLVNDLPNFAAVIENLDQFNQNIFLKF